MKYAFTFNVFMSWVFMTVAEKSFLAILGTITSYFSSKSFVPKAPIQPMRNIFKSQ